MAISYDKLWNLVRKNKMKKGDLAKAAEISGYTMAKLGKDEPVQKASQWDSISIETSWKELRRKNAYSLWPGHL